MSTDVRLTRTTGRHLLILAIALVGLSTGSALGQKALTKDEVVRLLPQGIDMLDHEQLNNYNQLVELGGRAYPGLIELLAEVDSSIMVSRIVSILVQSEGDKRQPRAAIKSILVRFPSGEREDIWCRIFALTALGRIGTIEDVASVTPFLDDADEKVRVNALRTLGLIGDEESAKQIEMRIERWRADPNDRSSAEAARSLEVIRGRS